MTEKELFEKLVALAVQAMTDQTHLMPHAEISGALMAALVSVTIMTENPSDALLRSVADLIQKYRGAKD